MEVMVICVSSYVINARQNVIHIAPIFIWSQSYTVVPDIGYLIHMLAVGYKVLQDTCSYWLSPSLLYKVVIQWWYNSIGIQCYNIKL